MPVAKKPIASSSDGPVKKRKGTKQPKFYAVKAGRNVGVFTDYEEVKKSCAGFPGSIFKSFLTKENALAFVNGEEIEPSPDEPQKFYAVAVGTVPGIYTEWSKAQASLTGAARAKQRKFNTREEAVEFIKMEGGEQAWKNIGLKYDPDYAGKQVKEQEIKDTNDGALRIWTDGASRGNGQSGAQAGIGVFFGHGDPRNISEPLRGEQSLQTNQRAELMAIQRALEAAPLDRDVEIFSDSQYSINCMTLWAKGWKKNGWRSSTSGEDVKHRDIIEPSVKKIEERDRKGAKTIFTKVKGHGRDVGNNMADMLAVNGAKMASKPKK